MNECLKSLVADFIRDYSRRLPSLVIPLIRTGFKATQAETVDTDAHKRKRPFRAVQSGMRTQTLKDETSRLGQTCNQGFCGMESLQNVPLTVSTPTQEQGRLPSSASHSVIFIKEDQQALWGHQGWSLGWWVLRCHNLAHDCKPYSPVLFVGMCCIETFLQGNLAKCIKILKYSYDL